MALTDRALVGCALWAQGIANEDPGTPGHDARRALAAAVVAGRYDVRVKEYCVAFWGDSDTTAQADVDMHAAAVLDVFQKLGLS